MQLWNDKKEPINETVPTRKAFMEFAGEKIPNLKIRAERIKQAQARMQAHQVIEWNMFEKIVRSIFLSGRSSKGTEQKNWEKQKKGQKRKTQVSIPRNVLSGNGLRVHACANVLLLLITTVNTLNI